jgi:hypothetical protein
MRVSRLARAGKLALRPLVLAWSLAPIAMVVLASFRRHRDLSAAAAGVPADARQLCAALGRLAGILPLLGKQRVSPGLRC